MGLLSGLGGPLIGAAASLFGSSSAAKAQRSANQTNIQLQREQQAWEANMANTAHQREVEDLRAAGLNPILSGMGGGGATTPSVAPAQVQSTYKGGAPEAFSAAMLARQMAAQVNLTEQQARSAEKDGDIKELESRIAGYGLIHSAEYADQRYRQAMTQADLVKAQVDATLKSIGLTESQIKSTDWDVLRKKLDYEQAQKLYPIVAKLQDTELLLKALSATGAKNTAELEEKLGWFGKAATFIKSIVR